MFFLKEKTAWDFMWWLEFRGVLFRSAVSSTKGDEPVVVSPAGPTITTQQIPAAATLADTDTSTLQSPAKLACRYIHTGNIVFKLYAPSNSVVDPETVGVSGNGTCTTPTGSMLLFFLMIRGPPRSTLFPDATLFRSAVSSTKGDEPVVVSPAGPTITTQQIPAAAT